MCGESAYVQIGVRCSVFFVRYCDELAPGVWLSVYVQIGVRCSVFFVRYCDELAPGVWLSVYVQIGVRPLFLRSQILTL